MKFQSIAVLLFSLFPAVAFSQWLPSGANDQVDIGRTGNVGIGTTAPNVSSFSFSRVLTILSPAGSGRGVLEIGSHYDAPGHIAGLISFFNTTSPAGSRETSAIWSRAESGGTLNNRGYSLVFLTKPDFAVTTPSAAVALERMRIQSNGEVVIGSSTDPLTTKLSVHGDVYVRGNIGAKYQDLAEWVPAASDLEPGTVVVLDALVRNQVTASTRAYDTTVAGVVSAQPGIILGEAGDTKEQIATTGRVKVRVDATAAPIRIGDLLVTGEKTGTAMRSHAVEIGGVALHRPGTVIGKALEPLAAGTGEILVLLSLQ